MKTVVGLFDYIEDAESAVIRLEKAGFERHDISVMADNTRRHADQFNTGSASAAEDMPEVIAADAAAGAAVGGATGLLMALTGLVIPGFGPIVAAGWLVSTLAGAAVGAAAGGLIGLLTGAGIPLEDAIYYKEGLKAGATLIAVRVGADRAREAAGILEQQGAINIDERAEEYRRQGLLSPTDNSVLQRPVEAEAGNIAGTGAGTQAETNEAAPSAPLSVTPPAAAATMASAPVIVEEPMPPGSGARIYPHAAAAGTDPV